MNFFGKRFTSGKPPPRKSVSLNNLKRSSGKSAEDISAEFDHIKINFGGQKVKFKDGEWITETGKNSSSSEVSNLKQKLKEKEEENYLLKLKVEILLDMLTEKSAENLLKDKQLTKYKERVR